MISRKPEGQKSGMRLRPYQRGMVRDVRAAFDDGAQSVVLQLPTGGGKTVIASTFMRDHSLAAGPIWFVCHRREILGQTSRTLAALKVPHGVIAPDKPRDPSAALQVCSVDSLRRMAATLPAPGLVIWDECHHIAARTWANLKAELRDARHLGLTATPARLDGKGLGEHFDRIVCGPDTRSLIEGGHLSPYRAFGPSVPDLRGIKSKAGDFDKTQLAERMNDRVIVGCAVEHYKRLAPGSRAVAFAASVENSKAIVARFNAAGVPALHVDGSTPPAERDAAVEALRTGRVLLLSNVEVFTEGFDLPAVEAIILLRPTKSYALFRQMIGRGLRPAPGKERVVIQDHAGLIYTHGMPDDDPEWTLNGANPKGERAGGGEDEDVIVEVKPRLRVCPECSAIHEWDLVCIECGHKYEKDGRSVEEVFGSLLEIRPPYGCESRADFAKRLGLSVKNMHRLFKRGIPSPDGVHVDIEKGTAWCADHYRRPIEPPLGFESLASFAKRIGRKPASVNYWKRHGFPIHGGIVNISDGLDWVSKNISEKVIHYDPKKIPEGYEIKFRFAKSLNVSSTTVYSWIKKGMPIRSDGLVPVDSAKKWILENIKATAFGGEDYGTFAQRFGVNRATVVSWIKRGMPEVKGARGDVRSAIKWVNSNARLKAPDGCETMSGFSRRTGLSMATLAKYIKAGMPVKGIKYVDVAAAEKWLRRERHDVYDKALMKSKHKELII